MKGDLKKNILILANTFYPAPGGMEKEIKLLVENLAANGWKVNVVFRKPDGFADNNKNDNLKLNPIQMRFSGFLSKFEYFFKALFKSIKFLDKDTVIIAFQLSATALVGLTIKLIYGNTFILRNSGGGKWGDIRKSEKYFLGRIKLKFCLDGADNISVMNKEMKKEVLEYDYPANKISTIPTAVDLSEFKPCYGEAKSELKKKLMLPYDLICIYSGRLHQGKGIMELADIWDKITTDDSALIFLGDGPLMEDLKKRQHDMKSKMILRGYIHNVDKYLAVSDIFVLFSESEGISNALLEAMASETACIVSNIEGNNEVIRDEKDGLLVSQGNKTELREAVLKLIRNPELRDRLSKNARVRIKEKYSISSMISKWEEIISK